VRTNSSYFDLKRPHREVLAARWRGGLVLAGYLARVDLDQVVMNTPCPHQIAAPCLPSRRVRSQP
jgi:hypothetical protein